MNEEFKNNNGMDQNAEQNSQNTPNAAQEGSYNPQSTYRYTGSQINQETSRWKPDQEKYGYEKAPEPEVVTKKQKTQRRWWIPIVVILSVMVIVIAVGVGFGVKIIKNRVVSSKLAENTITLEDIIKATEKPESDSNGEVVLNTSESPITKGAFVLTDVSDVVEQAMPSVVSITSRAIVNSGGYYGYFGGYFGNFGNYGDPYGGTEKEVESGIGSGTIVGKNDNELLILTSNHVVDGCSSLYVTFNDDSAVDGYVKAAATDTDIAIVAVPLEDISEETLNSIEVAKLCTDDVKVGEGVIVIGDALGYGQSVVTGIVSAVNRPITVQDMNINVIQTDAAINNGNSGGCMLNSKGEIIGISEAKITVTAVEGMCYAIPIKENYDLIIELMNTETKAKEEETPKKSGQGAYLGIYGRDIDSTLAQQYNLSEGIYVLRTVVGGGAEAAGIQEGDIIIKFDGRNVAAMAELQELLTTYNADDVVTVTALRFVDGQYVRVEFEVTLTPSIS